MDYDVEIHGLDELERKFAQFDQIAGDEIQKAMNNAVFTVVREAKAKAPRNFGNLVASINGVVTNLGGPVAQISGVVGAYAPYARVMEFGASPFWPNIAELELWVERKFQLKGAEAQRVAFFVGRAISRYGLKPRLFMQEGLKKARPKVKTEFEQAVQRIVDRLTTAEG